MLDNLSHSARLVSFESPQAVLDRIPLKGKLLIITDKDGTLDNSHQTEAIHATPSNTIDALTSICSSSDYKHSIAVISGRSLVDLRALTGSIKGCWYYGNHGIEWHHPGEIHGNIEAHKDYLPRLDRYEGLLREGVSKKDILRAHVKIERDDYKLNAWWSAVEGVRESFLDLFDYAMQESGVTDYAEIISGINSRELLPRGAGKNYAVSAIVRTLKPDFIICAGNDMPDLGMYQAVSNSGISHLNVVIGSDITFNQAIHFKSPDCLTELFIGISSKISDARRED